MRVREFLLPSYDQPSSIVSNDTESATEIDARKTTATIGNAASPPIELLPIRICPFRMNRPSSARPDIISQTSALQPHLRRFFDILSDMPSHETVQKPFSLLVKPAGGSCNLDCRYCFYKDHAAGQMPPALFRKMLDSYCALPFSQKSVTLQGGEPLLADRAIFEAMNGAPTERAVQTNTTLMTDELAAMFASHHWLVGASLDGPPQWNRNRGDSFDAAVRGIRRLEKAGADYNLLTVVSKANVGHPAEVYRFLRDNFATRYHQYIECTGPFEEITGEEWGRFLIGLFDEWFATDAHTVSIRMFDSIVSFLACGFPTQCSFADTCHHYLTVEHDGSVYPCDFYVRPGLRLGNVATDSWEAMLNEPIYRTFAERKSAMLPPACLACEFAQLCRGDCPRNRRSLCAGWKAFFAHALPGFQALVAAL